MGVSSQEDAGLVQKCSSMARDGELHGADPVS